jgi:uncharacterized protein YcfJ
MRKTTLVAFVAVVCLAGADAFAQGMYVYPEKGQSAEQQTRDKAECGVWATQQTGFDPATAAPPSSQAPQAQGQVVRGAARGAALGAAMGAIAGDAGKGAAMGAAGGGMIGGMRRMDASRQAESSYQQQQAAYASRQAEYQKALGACLRGRGYSVN